jgi:endonuclease/exonuclease/phosphatase family metal-dependent hydrolase
MKRLLALVTLVGCHNDTPVTVPSLSSAPSPMAVPARTGEPEVIRVMSYNVNFGVAGDPEGAQAIAQGHPDVVFLQETNDAWARSLTAAFPDAATRWRSPRDDEWPAGGMGVISKFPIVSIDELSPPKDAPFFAWRVVLDIRGQRVQFLDVHLRPPMSDDGSWIKGYWTTRGVRHDELAMHLEKLDKKLPTMIVGDFNEEGDGQAIGYARDRGFVDAIAAYAGDRTTWSWPVGSITQRFQLDHILVDERVNAHAAGIIEAGRSDHKPVWADVTFLAGL